MRTAITVATQHNGVVGFLSDTTVPIDEQKKAIKAMKGLREHPDFSLVQLWDSAAGVVSTVRFGKPGSSPEQPEPAEEKPADEKPADEKPKKPKK